MQYTPVKHFNDQPLLDMLVKKGILDLEESKQITTLSQQQDDNIVRLLVKLGWVSEHDMMSILAGHCGVPIAERTEYPQTPLSNVNISLRFMKAHQFIISQNKKNDLVVIMSDPSNTELINALRFSCGDLPIIKVGLASDIERSIEHIYAEKQDNDADDLQLDSVSNENDIERLKDLASEAPIVQLVNKVLQKAAEIGASDIHIEPFDKVLKIRYRVDGILSEESVPPNHSSAAIISRVKIMANLDIAERRLPQDGRIMNRSHGKILDIRVSTLPTSYGESVVMRVLNRDSLTLNFEGLGFNANILPDFLEALNSPHGIILVTGPTGSGKSTTLYTALSYLNKPETKIITVEDPVEYQLEGVNQLAVKTNIGLSFVSALRAIVRQDPDIIMIGEMRDVETAKIAIQSALTGHLVLSTLHTNSAALCITRLLNMGVENYLLISTIKGILGQRLVRKLCNGCKEAVLPSPEQLEMLGLDKECSDVTKLYVPKGCTACGHTGYKGRRMITEWLPITEAIQELIIKKEAADTLQKMAIKEGMVSIFRDGCQMVINGETSIDEVLRVSQFEGL